MALITCPECQKQISEFAKMCPHCGYLLSDEGTIGKKKNYALLALFCVSISMALLSIVLFVIFSRNKENKSVGQDDNIAENTPIELVTQIPTIEPTLKPTEKPTPGIYILKFAGFEKGISRKKIKDTHSKKPLLENDISAQYPQLIYEGSLEGYKCDIVYFFGNEILTSGAYYFRISDKTKSEKALQELETYLDSNYKRFSKNCGPGDGTSNSIGEKLIKFWYIGDSSIRLLSHKNYIIIRYHL